MRFQLKFKRNKLIQGDGRHNCCGGSLVESLARTLAAPNYSKLVARLVGSVPDYPQLMSVYWRFYILPRRKTIRGVLERAQSEGLIRKDSDPEILLDLIGGAVMYHLLVRPRRHIGEEIRRYLYKVLRELGLTGTGKGI